MTSSANADVFDGTQIGAEIGTEIGAEIGTENGLGLAEEGSFGRIDEGGPRSRIDSGSARSWGEDLVSRALRHHTLWLSLAYVGLILLMARTYA